MTSQDVESVIKQHGADMRRLDDILIAADSSSETAALVVIDLDGFDDIVIERGIKRAAVALNRIGKEISAGIPNDWDCSFVRADRIWLTVSNSPSAAGVEAYTLHALQVIANSREFIRSAISVTGVAGIALYPDDGENSYQIAAAAHTALKIAHSEMKRVVRADSTLIADQSFKRWIQSEFPTAINAGQISFVYQPIVSLKTNKIEKLESLARWKHPDRGPVSPEIFIPQIENSSFIDELFNLALNTALKDQCSWTENGLDASSVVNVSAHNLERWDLAEKILSALEQWGITPNKFSIELTETTLIQRGRQAGSTLAELFAAGMTISLDDFGTGYSSLSQISDYPISNVKIDRSITSQLVHSKKHRSIIKALLLMAEDLDFNITAEGVETEADVKMATELGCDLAQGYAFARPMTLESVLQLPTVLPVNV